MLLRIGIALVGWHALASLAGAQPRDVKVSGPTRLDWEFVAAGFGGDPIADVPADYDSKKQKYQLYVPDQFAATKAWPLIVFISPGPGPVGWPNFESVCAREGILFCSPYKAGNATCPDRIRIIFDMADDVRRRFPIDPNQTYIGGFGGAAVVFDRFCHAEILPESCQWYQSDQKHALPASSTRRPCLGRLRHRPKGFQPQRARPADGRTWKELDIRTQFWSFPEWGMTFPGGRHGKVVGWLAADLSVDSDAKTAQLNVKFEDAFRRGEADRLPPPPAVSSGQERRRVSRCYRRHPAAGDSAPPARHRSR